MNVSVYSAFLVLFGMKGILRVCSVVYYCFVCCWFVCILCCRNFPVVKQDVGIAKLATFVNGTHVFPLKFEA